MVGQVIPVIPKPSLAVLSSFALALSGVLFPLSLDSCTPMLGVASAEPSPTCGSDLRECLHAAAKTGMYGVRYVLAEDVRRCTDFFDACIHGSVRGTPNGPRGTSPGGSSTSTGGQETTSSSTSRSFPPKAGSPKSTSAGGTGLPDHFGIDHGNGGASDCQRSGDSVSCTENWRTATDTYTGSLTGTISGWTITATRKTHRVNHSTGCSLEEDYVGPVTYTLSPGGGAEFTAGPNRVTSSGCSSNSFTTDVMHGTATWAAIG